MWRTQAALRYTKAYVIIAVFRNRIHTLARSASERNRPHGHLSLRFLLKF